MNLKGGVPGYDNIWDFSTPEEQAKPGTDVVPNDLQQDVKPTFSNPQLYQYDGENDGVPTFYLPYQTQNKDPDQESQFPSLTLDSPKPNDPSRRRPTHAYLTDQSPDSKDNPEREVNDRGSDYEHWGFNNEDQIGVLPDPFIEVVARSIVAEYNLKHHPAEINPLERQKVAWTVEELVQATSGKSLQYEPGCSASFRKVRKKINRYDFHVTCGESWSDPSGHVVKIKLSKNNPFTKGEKSTILVGCSCPFWKYYGCDFEAKQKDYLEGNPRSNGAPPTQAMHKGHWICKHVAACVPLIRNLIVTKG